jgi:hypothetical protein
VEQVEILNVTGHQRRIGQPEHSSSEVCLAMARAATVSRIASGPLAEVLAEPLRWPTYR